MTLPLTPSLRLNGRRALVTGGTRGIGFACAAGLAQAGAKVVIAARTVADVEASAMQISAAGYRCEGVALDITDTAAVAALIGGQDSFDILVNCAGTAQHQSFGQISEDAFETVMAVNVRAALFLSQSVAQKLIAQGRGGSIITISSQMGHVGGPGRTVYCASKFAVEGMTRAMAIELGKHNIRVNTVCPTFIETELTSGFLADPQFRAWVMSKIKLGRLGRVEDIMGPVVFLASEASAMITGSSIMVDGGWTAE